jgi:lipoprotein-anchoring transpeptidase ErfK/SrfK
LHFSGLILAVPLAGRQKPNSKGADETSRNNTSSARSRRRDEYVRERQGLPPLARLTVGTEFKYTVKTGDSLVSIGARNGIESKTLASMNGLKPNTPLKPGQVPEVDNRHIVPADFSDGILINLPQGKLFYLNDDTVEGNYPIGPGKAAFATPIGSFSVIQMRENPTWYVPKSIQDERARAGKVVKKTVPPGPNNPVGGYWDRVKLCFLRYPRNERSTLDL